MALNQAVSVSLALIGLCGLAGAGVAVGSGVGMMAMQMQAAEAAQTSAAVAHSPLESSFARKGAAPSFASQQ